MSRHTNQGAAEMTTVAQFLAAARSAEEQAAREFSASARQFWLTIAATHRNGAAMLAQMGR